MSAFIKKYPILSMFILSFVFAAIPFGIVAAGWLPVGFRQFSALSASLAGIVAAAIAGRKGGVRELLKRGLIWRVGIQWWAIALFFTIIPSIAGLYLFNLLGGPTVDWSGLQPLYTVVPSIIMLTILAGIGEEYGWRGFALPRLQTRYNALVSSIIIGTLWSIWHIPLYFLEGSLQYNFRMDAGLIPAILGYTVYLIAWSIQFTWIFNNTKGSVLLAAVFHGAGNAWMGSYIDVYRGYWGGVLTHAAVSVVIAIVIVVLAGPTHLSRKNNRDVLEG